MWRRIIQTDSTIAPLVARLALALVLFPHGAQHLLGWFGGYGFQGTLGWMTGTAGFPAPLAALAIVVEFVAPIALVLGLLGRPAALGLFGLMLGAATVHTGNGFFMNWFGQMPAGTEGFEYHIIALGLSATLVLTGSGAYSIDRLLADRRAAPGRLGAARA